MSDAFDRLSSAMQYQIVNGLRFQGLRPVQNESIDAILDGSLDQAEFVTMPLFGISIPKAVAGVESEILNPRNTWSDKDAYDAAAKKLAQMFIDNFKTFTDNADGKALESAGPSLA